MPSEPRHPPIVPSYGGASLADLSASVAAAVGVPSFHNVLGVTPARRACILLVDGLGWEQLRDHPAAAPFLSELARNSRPLAAGFPSTTVTSLASLCTGLPPGQHGMLGYQVLIPGTSRLLNGLRWDSRVDPQQWQSHSTIYERAADAGIPAFHVAQSSFRGSGLTSALMRGAEYIPADTMGALAAQAASVLAGHSRAYVTVYHGDLDATGHVFGVGSDAWFKQLAHVDKLAEHLAASLPPATVLYITADHGMVNVLPDDRVDIDAEPALREGVAVLGGEPRARHVYASPGAAQDVLATWRDVLGDRAWVLSREEAIKEGWFGPVAPELTDRIGDVLAAPAGSTALVATQAEPRESALFGMHGSLTPSDMLIPALAYPASLATGILRRMTFPPEDTPGSATLLVPAAELAAGLAGPNPPTVIDARWRLGGPPGIDDYVTGHIPGAAYIDLHRDLAGTPGPEGRHPLPDTAAFQAVMRAAGVRNGHAVVVYDDGDGLPAARTWWSLRYFGHDDVRVLDGGYRAWTEAGLASASDVAGTAGDFTASPGHMPLLDAAGAEALARDGGLLLDVRAAERYRGEIEPIDPVAGHIPGAVNAPIANTANADGTYRTPAELRAYFDGLRDAEHGGDVGAYCGSGVTAARGVFALALAGIPAALYVGSWSNWTADPTRPIATS